MLALGDGTAKTPFSVCSLPPRPLARLVPAVAAAVAPTVITVV